MKFIYSVVLGFTAFGCTVQSEAESGSGISVKSEPLVADDPSWSGMAFEGEACAELFAPIALASGTDVSFLPGLGTTAAPRSREVRRCGLTAELAVPRGQYVVSLSYTLGYGGVKPEGSRFALDSEFRLRDDRREGDVDLVEPKRVAFDDAFDVLSTTCDTTASRRELCARQRASRVGFSDVIRLSLEARGGEVILDVDSIDVGAVLAPCPAPVR